jgi:hypothetical protein
MLLLIDAIEGEEIPFDLLMLLLNDDCMEPEDLDAEIDWLKRDCFDAEGLMIEWNSPADIETVLPLLKAFGFSFPLSVGGLYLPFSMLLITLE